MSGIIISAVAFISGLIVACLLIAVAQARRRLMRLKNKNRKRVRLDTYAKAITTIVVGHGMLLTSCSYILSYFGMDPVVDVSSTIVREIVAPVIVYLATNMIMNIFEKNKMIFSVPLNSSIVGKDRATHSGSEESAG